MTTRTRDELLSELNEAVEELIDLAEYRAAKAGDDGTRWVVDVHGETADIILVENAADTIANRLEH